VLGPGNGQGSAFVSLDRKYSNLHYGMAVTRLSSLVTGAHFHNGAVGVNGPVIFPLTSSDSLVTGSWNDATFTSDIADLFESGMVYSNFHTTMNPGGEIRGQVNDQNLCDNITGLEDQANNGKAAAILYPNPVVTTATLSYSLPQTSDVIIRVYNLLGTETGTLVNGNQPAGDHTARLDATRLQEGVYFYTLMVNGNISVSGKILVAK
jgi:hypothetical protein